MAAEPTRTDDFLIEYAFIPRFSPPPDALGIPAWQEAVRSQVSDEEYLISKGIYDQYTVPLTWPVPPRHLYRVLAAFRRKAQINAGARGFTAGVIEFHEYVGLIISELSAEAYSFLKDERTMMVLAMQSSGVQSSSAVDEDESEDEDSIHERFRGYEWDDYGKDVYIILVDRLGLRDGEDTERSDTGSDMDSDIESYVEGDMESDLERDAPVAKRRQIEGDCPICFTPLKVDRTPEQADFCDLMCETFWLSRENTDSNEDEQSQEGDNEDENHGNEHNEEVEDEDDNDNDNDNDDNDDGLVGSSI
ncbi:hypothetical protein BJY00DRAFT_308598 [Aspergillus carlsbadensis]|nr:hypothetical protein BJY00DRAFT_308598 [Aspergillus carlsbadensis]